MFARKAEKGSGGESGSRIQKYPFTWNQGTLPCGGNEQRPDTEGNFAQVLKEAKAT